MKIAILVQFLSKFSAIFSKKFAQFFQLFTAVFWGTKKGVADQQWPTNSSYIANSDLIICDLHAQASCMFHHCIICCIFRYDFVIIS